ncbi:(3R)-3-hydroxyacyl-CoA dehydrogenase-like [Branchiostoma floridae x Branchiostoma japonicum]
MGSQQHRFYRTDVSSSTSVNQMVTSLRADYPSAPSVVVTCAGVAIPSYFLDMDEATYDKVTNINQKGTFLVVQAMARLMVEDKVKNGSIVTMGSICGRVQEKTFLKRAGKPSEVANLCLFLATEESSYMTGQVVEITGGQ